MTCQKYGLYKYRTLEVRFTLTLQPSYGLFSLTWSLLSAFLGLNIAQKHVATKQNGKHQAQFNSISLDQGG